MKNLRTITLLLAGAIASGCTQNDDRMTGDWVNTNFWDPGSWTLNFKADGNARLETNEFTGHAKWETEDNQYLLFSENSGLLSRRCSYDINTVEWDIVLLELDGCITPYNDPIFFVRTEDVERRRKAATEEATEAVKNMFDKLSKNDSRGVYETLHARMFPQGEIMSFEEFEPVFLKNIGGCEHDSSALKIQNVVVSKIFNPDAQEAVVEIDYKMKCNGVEANHPPTLSLIGGKDGWLVSGQK